MTNYTYAVTVLLARTRLWPPIKHFSINYPVNAKNRVRIIGASKFQEL